MSWSSLASAKLALPGLVVLAALAIMPAAPQADQASREPRATEPPSKPAPAPEPAKPSEDDALDLQGKEVQEVIIDDSGIILRQEDGDVQVDVDDETRRAVDINVRTSDSNRDDEGEVHFGKDVIVRAHEVVQEDMLVLFGDLTVYGKVVGDILVLNGDVRLFDGAEVTGDITCIGGKVDSEEGAQVFGEISPVGKSLPGLMESCLNLKKFSDRDHHAEGFKGAFFSLVADLILAWVGMILLRTRIPNLSLGLRSRPGHSLLLGFLTLLAALLLLIPLVLLLVLLALTIVGIPVVILSLIALIGLGFLGWLVPLYTVSRYTFEARGLSRFLSVGLWAVLFWIFSALGDNVGPRWPFVLIELLVFLFGIGAMVMTRLGARRLAVP